MIKSIKIYGDQALLLNFEQKIDPTINAAVIALKNALDQANIDGVTYQIPAYCSLTVGYNPKVIDFETLTVVIRQISSKLFDNWDGNVSDTLEGIRYEGDTRQLKIPVCYEAPYALDMQELSKEKGLSVEKIIDLHTRQIFKVYLLGFLPGFVFMGKLPDALQCNRKVTPRLRVPASSVGIAGFQTGIYPTESPGGWQIIGRTPLSIFNPQRDNPFHFRAGDEVQFYSISAEEFTYLSNQEKSRNEF